MNKKLQAAIAREVAHQMAATAVAGVSKMWITEEVRDQLLDGLADNAPWLAELVDAVDQDLKVLIDSISLRF
jgi:hypothetical protein